MSERRTPHVDALDPLGYTDEEFYRARCADLQDEIERLRTLETAVGRTLDEMYEGAGMEGDGHVSLATQKQLLEAFKAVRFRE